MNARSPLATLLAIDADRCGSVQDPARAWLAPTTTSLAALVVGGLAEAEFRAGGGPRVLSLAVFLFDAALSALVVVRFHSGPSDILRSTALMPVSARDQALFLLRTLARTPSVIALLLAGSGFPIVVASASASGALCAGAVLAAHALCLLGLVTASFLWVIRRRKPPALIGATAFLALLFAVAAAILFSLSDPLGLLLPVAWTASGVLAAASGDWGGALTSVLLLVLPLPPLAFLAAHDGGGR